MGLVMVNLKYLNTDFIFIHNNINKIESMITTKFSTVLNNSLKNK